MATLDNDAPLIFARSAEWIRAHARAATRAGARGDRHARRRRGRRDNGLDAALWTPLRDVDPRVGEHLLDVLEAAGIAAYLEPAADVGPTPARSSCPARRRTGCSSTAPAGPRRAALVERHGRRRRARPAPPEPAAGAQDERRDLDEDAEWARIVAAFEAENGRIDVDGRAPRDGPPPPAARAGDARPPDEHYEPPPPPPLPVPAPASLYAVLLIGPASLLVGRPG